MYYSRERGDVPSFLPSCLAADGNDSGGRVVIEGETITESVYGWNYSSQEKDAIGGSVLIEKSEVPRTSSSTIYGGDSGQEASYNRVVINDSTTKNITGGHSYNTVSGAGNNAVVSHNTVEINDSHVKGFIYGGHSNRGDVMHNNVVIKNSNNQGDETFPGWISTYPIYGGYSGSSGNSYNNTVELLDQSHIYGSVSGGESLSGDVFNNRVRIVDSTVSKPVSFSSSGDHVAGGSSWDGNVYNNIVEIDDSTIETDIYGGYIDRKGSAKNNTVILHSGTNAEKANLYGSNQSNFQGSSNNLILDAWSGSVNSVNYFDQITLHDVSWKNGGTLVQVLNEENKQMPLDGTDIHIRMANGSVIRPNDRMTLFEVQTPQAESPNFNVNREFTAGVATVGTGYIEVSDADTQKNVDYVVQSVSANPQVQLLADNRAVSAAFVNQGDDLISDGLDSLSHQDGYGFKTFAAMHGAQSRYDVNSGLKINGWNEIFGVGEKKRFRAGDFAYSIFYESGSGNYRTYNRFADEFFRGDGSLTYHGGGAAVRLQKKDGLYYEGSFRAGTIHSDLDNALQDNSGHSYGYDDRSAYYGAHVGIGKIWALDEHKELNVYGKFFHTYVEGDDATIASDRFSFDSITSDRLRVGAEIMTDKQHPWSVAYGLAYEYEFNGDSTMMAGPFSVRSESLQGGTVIGKLGLRYQNGEASPWAVDLNVQGYGGQRDGCSGNIMVTYMF